jgi:O-antigen ligase
MTATLSPPRHGYPRATIDDGGATNVGPGLNSADLTVLVALAPVLVSRWDTAAALLLVVLGVIGVLRALQDGRLSMVAVAFLFLGGCLIISGIGTGSLPPPTSWRRFFATDGRILLLLGPALYLGGGRARYGPTALRRPFTIVGWLLGAQVLVHPALGDRLFTGTLSSHHSAGALAGVTIVVLTMLLSGGLARRARMTTVVGIVGAAAALVLSGSRASLLGCAAAVGVVIVRRLRPERRRVTLALGGLALFAAISAIPRFAELPANATDAARGIFEDEALERSGVSVTSRNTALRVEAWRIAARTGAEHPWVGAGAFRSDDIITAELGVSTVGSAERGVNSVFSAHNAYLYAFAELGLLGLVLHALPYAMLLGLARRSPPQYRIYRPVAYGALMVLAVASLTSNAIVSPAAVIPVLTVAFAFRSPGDVTIDSGVPLGGPRGACP